MTLIVLVMVNNLKEAKELLEIYKSITLEQLEEAYGDKFLFKMGDAVLNEITGFGRTNSCILCLAVNEVCENCIYSFRLQERNVPCLDKIYNEICNAMNAEDLFAAIQKRISYLNNVIQWFELQE